MAGCTSLSVRQREFAAGLLAGKTQRQAALDAGAPKASADVWASTTLRNPKFHESFNELLEQAGIGDEHLAQALAQLLKATKVLATRTRGGRITDVLEGPDYLARLRAIELAFLLRGRLTQGRRKKAEVPAEGVALHIVPDGANPSDYVAGFPRPAAGTAADGQHVDDVPNDPKALGPRPIAEHP